METNAVYWMEMFILVKFHEECKQSPPSLPIITKVSKIAGKFFCNGLTVLYNFQSLVWMFILRPIGKKLKVHGSVHISDMFKKFRNFWNSASTWRLSNVEKVVLPSVVLSKYHPFCRVILLWLIISLELFVHVRVECLAIFEMADIHER
jgi:hypothetical protein